MPAQEGWFKDVFSGLFFLTIAYAAGRWQFDKAGKTIDRIVKDKPVLVAGVVTTAAGLYAHDQVPDHPMSILVTLAGLTLLGEEAAGLVKGRFGQATDLSSSVGLIP